MSHHTTDPLQRMKRLRSIDSYCTKSYDTSSKCDLNNKTGTIKPIQLHHKHNICTLINPAFDNTLTILSTIQQWSDMKDSAAATTQSPILSYNPPSTATKSISYMSQYRMQSPPNLLPSVSEFCSPSQPQRYHAIC